MTKHNPQYSETENTIAVDLDGVIHKNSKGYYDGTIYDEPIEGSKEALKELSKKYKLIIFSTKCRPDREFPNGESGASNVRAWLEKYDLWQYIDSITVYKPPAKWYIDDRGITFRDWETTLELIKDCE